MTGRTLRSDLLLLLAAAIWGFAFVAQRLGMEHLGPFTFNGVRFALGSLALIPLLLSRGNRTGKAGPANPTFNFRKTLLGGALAGVVLFLGASLQQVGIVYTTAGKAGFITGLYVVIVPLLGLFWRQRPRPAAWVGAFLSVAGLFFLSVTESLTLSRGDSLVLACAFFFAVHVLLIGKLCTWIDSIQLAFMQFATCSLISLVVAYGIETVTLDALHAALLPILYAGLLSTGVAYTLQIVAQRSAPPSHAAILLSLEAVFAAMGGAMMLGEQLSTRALFGCGLMLGGAFLSQLYGRARLDGRARLRR